MPLRKHHHLQCSPDLYQIILPDTIPTPLPKRHYPDNMLLATHLDRHMGHSTRVRIPPILPNLPTIYKHILPYPPTLQLFFTYRIIPTNTNQPTRFIVGFSCIPLVVFLPKMTDKCIYSLPVWYLTSAMNILTDFIIFFIPIVPVCRLRISSQKKILLLFLFSLGFL